MEKIIEIRCLEHTYQDKTTVELCGINFIVNKGEKIALLGPNGGGKTTLIKHIIGLLRPTQTDSIKVFGLDPSKEFNKIRKRIGVVLQSIDEQLIGPTVLDDILFAPLNYGYSKDESLQMAYNIMEKFDITGLKNKIIHYLSGGEKRKVALAGALVTKPELLILDEPFAALDAKSQLELVDIINKYSIENQISIVLTTHEVELVSRFADTLYLIASGNKISSKGTPKEIFSQPELLEEFNLQQPSIIKLFYMLNESGISLKIPQNTEEAFDILREELLLHC